MRYIDWNQYLKYGQFVSFTNQVMPNMPAWQILRSRSSAQVELYTPARTYFLSGLKSRDLKSTFLK
jgi:hypothetical protein